MIEYAWDYCELFVTGHVMRSFERLPGISIVCLGPYFKFFTYLSTYLLILIYSSGYGSRLAFFFFFGGGGGGGISCL